VDHPPEYLSVKIPSRRLPLPLVTAVRRGVNWLLGFSEFNATYAPVIANGIPDNLAESFLDHIRVSVDVDDEAKARIPRTGPFVAVANHPFGMIEGLILNAVFSSVRHDYKFLAAYKLGQIPGFDRSQIFVDPLKQRRKRRMNQNAWHAVFKWVWEGGAFVVFPAGRVSRFSFRDWRVSDRPWSRHVGTLVRRTGAPVLPIYFSGANGLLFQLAGLIHGNLQNFLLIRQFNRMHGRRFKILIGELIQPDEIAAMGSDQGVINLLRNRTYALASGVGSVSSGHSVGAGKSTIS
jgi:putative hemolysin